MRRFSAAATENTTVFSHSSATPLATYEGMCERFAAAPPPKKRITSQRIAVILLVHQQRFNLQIFLAERHPADSHAVRVPRGPADEYADPSLFSSFIN